MPLSDSTRGDDRAFNRPLRVARLVATRAGDAERGPQVTLNPEDAKTRLLNEGELAWVYGPRRQELAEVKLDPALMPGDVILRDVVGSAPSETVRVIKPDLDRPKTPGSLSS
jgi:anaerobic selenocysteine-containing dehydrogenase